MNNNNKNNQDNWILDQLEYWTLQRHQLKLFKHFYDLGYERATSLDSLRRNNSAQQEKNLQARQLQIKWHCVDTEPTQAIEQVVADTFVLPHATVQDAHNKMLEQSFSVCNFCAVKSMWHRVQQLARWANQAFAILRHQKKLPKLVCNFIVAHALFCNEIVHIGLLQLAMRPQIPVEFRQVLAARKRHHSLGTFHLHPYTHTGYNDLTFKVDNLQFRQFALTDSVLVREKRLDKSVINPWQMESRMWKMELLSEGPLLESFTIHFSDPVHFEHISVQIDNYKATLQHKHLDDQTYYCQFLSVEQLEQKHTCAKDKADVVKENGRALALCLVDSFVLQIRVAPKEKCQSIDVCIESNFFNILESASNTMPILLA